MSEFAWFKTFKSFKPFNPHLCPPPRRETVSQLVEYSK